MLSLSRTALGFALTTLITAAAPALADDSKEPEDACSQEADYVFPSITVTPWTNVAVGAHDEFTLEDREGTFVVTHVGDAQVVRFPSLVAIGKTLELHLSGPATRYCLVSSVATFGGTIKIIGNADQVSTISVVGNVEF